MRITDAYVEAMKVPGSFISRQGQQLYQADSAGIFWTDPTTKQIINCHLSWAFLTFDDWEVTRPRPHDNETIVKEGLKFSAIPSYEARTNYVFMQVSNGVIKLFRADSFNRLIEANCAGMTIKEACSQSIQLRYSHDTVKLGWED